MKKCEGLPVADFDTGSSDAWHILVSSSALFHSTPFQFHLSDVGRYCKISKILSDTSGYYSESDMIKCIRWTVWNNGKTQNTQITRAKSTNAKWAYWFLARTQSWHSEENYAVVEVFQLGTVSKMFQPHTRAFGWWLQCNPDSAQDPYLRCTWDNMVMLSPIVKQSLRPVFNQSFYFPVRAPWLSMSAFWTSCSHPTWVLDYSHYSISASLCTSFALPRLFFRKCAWVQRRWVCWTKSVADWLDDRVPRELAWQTQPMEPIL